MKQEPLDAPFGPLDAAIAEILRLPRAQQVDALLELRMLWVAHPEKVARIDEELSLLALLDRLPTPSISSNFTARVLREIQSDSMPQPRSRASLATQASPLWARVRQFLPIAALASLAIGVTWLTHFSQLNQTAALNPNAADFPGTPGIEVLADFDAIQMASFRPSPAQLLGDVSLLSVLSQ